MRRILFMQVLVAFLCTSSHAQPTEADIQKLWNEKKYRDVIRSIDAYYAVSRKPVLKLDLMKITSMCQLGVTPPRTEDCFDYIVKAYKLSGTTKEKLYLARENCSNVMSVEDERDITATTELPRVAGKMGYTTSQMDYAMRGDTMKLIKHIPPETLRRRLTPDSTATDKAIAKWTSIFDSAGISNVKCRATGQFLVTYSKLSLTDAAFSAISIKLQNYYRFYVTEYNMNEAKHFIHVFLAADYSELNNISTKLYGFSPPSYTLGYSSLDDQSIVAIAYVPDKPLMGTTCHELFHILCKNNYESLPPWLEEGMASLYEVSEIRGNSIIGLNNWRIGYLRRTGGYSSHSLRYFRLKDLFELDWAKFNSPDRPMEAMQSFYYAYSRYLMLYLQRKGALKSFFREASSYGYMHIKEGVVKDYEKMVKKYAGVEDGFEQVFMKWVEGLNHN